MGLSTSPDSDTSLVSIEIAVARQIPGFKSPCQHLSTQATRTPLASVEKQAPQANQTLGKERSHEKLLSKSLEKTRKNSLLRVKNSTEVLRQRSTRAQHEAERCDGTSSTTKEGRHFTVGNVGTGGKLYLRYAPCAHVQLIMLMSLSPGRQQINGSSELPRPWCFHLQPSRAVRPTIAPSTRPILRAQDTAFGRVLRSRTSQKKQN